MQGIASFLYEHGIIDRAGQQWYKDRNKSGIAAGQHMKLFRKKEIDE